MGLGPGRKARLARPIFVRPGLPKALSKKLENPGAFFGPFFLENAVLKQG